MAKRKQDDIDVDKIRVSVAGAARLLKLTPERVRQLSREGWIEIEHGTCNLSQAVIGYERSLFRA